MLFAYPSAFLAYIESAEVPHVADGRLGNAEKVEGRECAHFPDSVLVALFSCDSNSEIPYMCGDG